MIKSLQPETFWKELHIRIARELAARDDWKLVWGSDPIWTQFMLGVLTEFGVALGFNEPQSISREFFRIDLAFFSPSVVPEAPRFHKWDSWNLDVAIELENNSESWFEEWIKLAHLRCGLKVLMAFHDARPTKPSIAEKLEWARQIYQGTSHCGDSDSWLLVFGPSLGQEGDGSFSAYSFDGTAFRELEKARILPVE
jgi:hypothetical protein